MELNLNINLLQKTSHQDSPNKNRTQDIISVSASEGLDRSNITFDNPRQSINRNSGGGDSENHESYVYERRRENNSSIFILRNTFDKVIIPYNFEKKKYEIRIKDIEFYEHKDYIIYKLEEYNNDPNFDFDKIHLTKNCLEWFKVNWPVILIMLILLYFAFLFLLLANLNPIVLYTLYSYLEKACKCLNMIKFIIVEKMKMKKLNTIILNENKSDNCIYKGINWKIGTSGYWMEVKKNSPE